MFRSRSFEFMPEISLGWRFWAQVWNCGHCWKDEFIVCFEFQYRTLNHSLLLLKDLHNYTVSFWLFGNQLLVFYSSDPHVVTERKSCSFDSDQHNVGELTEYFGNITKSLSYHGDNTWTIKLVSNRKWQTPLTNRTNKSTCKKIKTKDV